MSCQVLLHTQAERAPRLRAVQRPLEAEARVGGYNRQAQPRSSLGVTEQQPEREQQVRRSGGSETGAVRLKIAKTIRQRRCCSW
jgi:hypothetical protein